MKRVLVACAVAVFAMACQKSDISGIEVSDETLYIFNDMFPGVKGVTWEKRGVYRVAMFNYGGDVLSAWYRQDDEWCMTEKRLTTTGVPAQVTAAFSLSGSRGATNCGIDHIDLLMRDGIEDIYVVVTTDKDWYYYSGDGVEVKTLAAADNLYWDYRHEIVPQVPSQVLATVSAIYPSARVMELDVIFPGIIFVELIDNLVLKTMEFGLTGIWAGTKWPVSEQYVRTQAPQVYETYNSLGYTDRYVIDCIDCYHTSAAIYYWFTLDNNGQPTTVKIREDGNILAVN